MFRATSVLLVFWLHAAAVGASVDLFPVKDNTLYESENGTLSNGAGQHLFAGTTEFGAVRRGLLAFDVVSQVPTGAIVDLVSLRLHVSRTPAASEAVTIHRVTRDWGEGESRAFGQEGGGGPAVPGDATWIHTFADTAFWATAGGDFDPTPSASLVVTGIGFYTWDGGALAADVQSWLDNPSSNFGWLLQGEEETNMTAKRFDSREHSDPMVRPLLTLEYHLVPEPSTWCIWFALGIVLKRRTALHRAP